MRAEQINRVSTTVLTVLSLTALCAVVSGYIYRPTPTGDEGLAAHLFQLSIVALAPTGFLFLSSAEWTQPLRNIGRLTLPAAAVVVAFAALYYLEHFHNSAR